MHKNCFYLFYFFSQWRSRVKNATLQICISPAWKSWVTPWIPWSCDTPPPSRCSSINPVTLGLPESRQVPLRHLLRHPLRCQSGRTPPYPCHDEPHHQLIIAYPPDLKAGGHIGDRKALMEIFIDVLTRLKRISQKSFVAQLQKGVGNYYIQYCVVSWTLPRVPIFAY